MRTHCHPVPNGLLLILCADGDASGLPLPTALSQALQQDCTSIWVDCRHVATLPEEVLQLLRQYAAQLWQQGSHLLLCHLPVAVRAHLGNTHEQPLAAAPLDANFYGLDCPPAP